MTTSDISLSLTLLVSLGLNIYLGLKYFKKPPSQESKDLQLINDLMTSGKSLIEIRRIAPNNFFIRSPRD